MFNTTQVRYRGELIEVSIKEHKILKRRGHLKPVYGQASIVVPERGLELCSFSTTQRR